MNETLRKLEVDYNEELRITDGNESEYATQLREKYKYVNSIVHHHCDECGKDSKITCQYH